MQAAIGRLGLLGAIVPFGPQETAHVAEEETPFASRATDINVPLNLEALMREGKDTKTENVLTSTIKWSIQSQSFYNEDTGEIRLRLTHTLTTDILATDEITFETGFTSTSVTATATAQNTLITKDIA